jgi:ribosomal protein S18 acetylase RimI-like enzyme
MPPKYRIEFIQATDDDIEYLLNLRTQTMSEHLCNSKVVQTQDQMRERVLYRFDCAKIIKINGEKKGLLKVVKEGSEWELSQIQISPEYQEHGIGKEIIRNLIQEAGQNGARIKLSVLKENPARKLYERLGFKIITENDHAYRMLYLRTTE